MAVDTLTLVTAHLKPILEREPTLADDLPVFINAQMAQQGYDAVTITDKESNYVAALTLESLLPRLNVIFQQWAQEVREGPQNTRMPNRSEFFRLLQKAIDNLKESAGKGAGLIADDEGKDAKPWTGCGLVKWGSSS